MGCQFTFHLLFLLSSLVLLPCFMDRAYVAGQEYEATLQHEVACFKPEMVRAVNGWILCGPPYGIHIYSDPLETGQNMTLLTTIPTSQHGTFEVITYPDYPHSSYVFVAVKSTPVAVYELDKNKNLTGVLLVPVFQQTCYSDTNAVAIDYDHRIAITYGMSGLCRFNMTDPQNIRLLSRTSMVQLGVSADTWCCSPLAVFDNRLAVADQRNGYNVALLNLSTTQPVYIRSYLNAGVRPLWKHPSEEYILGTRQSEASIAGSTRVFFRVHLGTGLFQWYTFGDTSRSFKQLTSDTVGVLSDKADRIFLWKFQQPESVPESIRIVGKHQDFLIDRGRLIASSFDTPRLGIYNITERATGLAPTWLPEASMRMSGSQYLARNPLRLLTPVNIVLEGWFPIVLQSKDLQTIDVTGANFAFAPISYVVSNLTAGSQVHVWRDGSWMVCSIGQAFQQAEVDAHRVQVSVQNALVPILDMYAELRPTNWLGASAPTVTIRGWASSPPTTTSVGTTSRTVTTIVTSSTESSVPESIRMTTTTTATAGGATVTATGPTTVDSGVKKETPETTPVSRPGIPFLEMLATSVSLQILTAITLLMLVMAISCVVYLRIEKNRKKEGSKSVKTKQGGVPVSAAASTLNMIPIGSSKESSNLFKTVVDPRAMTNFSFNTRLPGYQTNVHGSTGTTTGFLHGAGQVTLVPDVNYLFFPAFAQYQNGVAYRMLKQIGGGGMATIWLCDIIEPNLRAAAEGMYLIAKVMRESSTNTAEIMERRTLAWRQEVSIGFFLRKHPNIVNTIGYSLEPYPTILLKYYQFGSLETLIQSKGTSVPGFYWSSKTRWELCQDCCHGLQFMHRNMVAHRDIKPDNILLTRVGNTGRIAGVLSDLGVAQILNQQNVVSAFQVQNLNAVTVRYAGPEVMQRFRMKITSISQPEEGLAGDLYALAIMLFEMLVLQKCW